MKNIPVRIGWELLIPINLLFFWILFESPENEWAGILIMGIVFIFMNYIFFSIKYKTDHERLYIKNGIFGTLKINIREISKIEKSVNLIASPAPSLFGRVEIYYGRNKSVVISPKSFNDFKNELLKINPDITVKEKI